VRRVIWGFKLGPTRSRRELGTSDDFSPPQGLHVAARARDAPTDVSARLHVGVFWAQIAVRGPGRCQAGRACAPPGAAEVGSRRGRVCRRYEITRPRMTACVIARLRLHVRQPIGIVECCVIGRSAWIADAHLLVDGHWFFVCVLDCRASLCVETSQSAALCELCARAGTAPLAPQEAPCSVRCAPEARDCSALFCRCTPAPPTSVPPHPPPTHTHRTQRRHDRALPHHAAPPGLHC